MTGKELVKKAQEAGWEIDRIASSHHIMVKGNKTVSIPVHAGKALGQGLLNKLLKQLGLRE
ncbi:MAG: type II toxin-antitoxin system HicA family toxin [Lachnospiraceae bacterium]|nr:type II toxin-antitoxin system HicA family toxin [Lachnospiraceae bacterium]